MGGNPTHRGDPAGLAESAAIWKEEALSRDMWGNEWLKLTFNYRGRDFPLSFKNCACCITGDTLLGDMKAQLASVIALVTEASITADSLKAKKDNAVANGGGNYNVSMTELILLRNFADFSSKGGKFEWVWDDNDQSATVDRIQEVLDDMYWWLRKGLTISCERWAGSDDEDSRGKASISKNLNEGFGIGVRTGNSIYLNCDALGSESGNQIQDTIIHELSHLASFTYDDVDKGRRNLAARYGKLAQDAEIRKKLLGE